MAVAAGPGGSTPVPKLLTRGLPATGIADLGPARPLRSVLGPGVIILATSIGSGEIYFWPGITMKYGFTLLWPALIALSLQYVINTEFARYTIATGETVVSGFTRLWKPFAWIFLLCSTLPWLWPGWSTGGAQALSWVVGGDPTTIAVVSLLSIGVALTGTRVVYTAVERIEKVLVAFIIVSALALAVAVVGTPTLVAFRDGLATIPTSLPPDLEIATLLAALAFCGAGGSINLATSHWMRDKGFGMGEHVPKVTSPLTGGRVAVASGGYFFSATRRNLEHWTAWWRVARREQTITFLIIGSSGLILFMLISHALVHGRELPIGMEMLRAEGDALADRWGPLVAKLFWLVVSAVFFTSALGVLDHVGRVSADIVKSSSARVRNSAHGLLSESALYFYVLWSMIGFAVAVLVVADIRDTPTLLRTAGSLSGVVMFLYSLLTLPLMARLARDAEAADARFAANNPFRLPWWRKLALAGAAAFYGGFSLLLIVNLLS